MKRLLLCCFLLLAGLVTAQEVEPAPQASAVSDEIPAHKEIAVLKQHMEDALNARDIDSALYGLAKEVIFSTMNGEVVRGRDNVKARLEQLMTGPHSALKDLTIKLDVSEPAVLYDETELSDLPRFAVAYGTADLTYTRTDGETFQGQPGWTATLVRDQDSWKIANFHIAVDMFDNPVVKKIQQKTLLTGALSLIVGLLLGWKAGQILSRT